VRQRINASIKDPLPDEEVKKLLVRLK